MELIKVSEKNGSKAVSARDLYAFLEIKTDFTSWFKRMFEYGFVEGVDYTIIHEFPKNGELENQHLTANGKIDYVLSLDCAKEISMIQRTERGKQARLYFIDCEKRANGSATHNLPTTYAQALLEAGRLALELENTTRQLEKAKPKIDFFDQVADSKDAIDLGSAAKILNAKMGRNKLFEFLRSDGVLMQNNLPYQQYQDLGWFRVIEQKYSKPDGSVHINTKTLVYQKGLQAIQKRISKASKKNL